MNERITLISHFDKNSTIKINERINKLGEDKNICKVPFGKNVDNREEADTLPFHFTMCAWNIIDEEDIISKLKQIKFSKLKIKVIGLNIMSGKENSYCLYFELEKNIELEKLQREIYNQCPSEKYNPDNFTFHITVHIDKNYEKIIRMKNVLEKNFKEIELVVENFGLYEIYPAKLVKIF